MKHAIFPYHRTLIILWALAVFVLVPTSGFAQEEPDDEDSGVAVATARPLSAFKIGSDDDEDDDKTPGATVRGRVVYADTGRPVRRAEINLVQMKNGYDDRSSKKVVTNSNGEFELTGIKAGSYLPYIKIPGVFNENSFKLMTQRFAGSGNGEKKSPVNQIVVAGLEEVNVFIEAKRGGAITGKISYFDGEPAVGMRVEALKKGTLGYEKNTTSRYDNDALNISTAVTDDRGVYRFSGLPEGEYLVRVVEIAVHTSRPERSYSSEPKDSQLKTYYPDSVNAKDAKPIELILGQEQSAIDLTIPDRRFFSIKGFVVAKSNKKPLKNFSVTFTKVNEEDAGIVQEYIVQQNSENTNALGEWDFVDLPQGKYVISVKPSYEYEEETAKVANAPNGGGKPREEVRKYASVSKEVTFEKENITDFVFEMPIEAVISGSIVREDGKPLAKDLYIYTIDAKKQEMSSSAFVRLQDNQTKTEPVLKAAFTLSGLNEGAHRILITDPDVYIKEVRFDNATTPDQKIEVKEGQQATGAQIILGSDFGTLKGKVNNLNKSLRTFIVMFARGKDIRDALSSGRQGLVKADGTFEVKAPAGEYSVMVVTEKDRYDPKIETQEEFLKRFTRNAASVTIKAKESSEITLDIPTR